MSAFTLLPVVKQESENLMCGLPCENTRALCFQRLIVNRLLGGFFMFFLGLTYLLLGETLANSPGNTGLITAQDWVSKSILGLQVGLPCPNHEGNTAS